MLASYRSTNSATRSGTSLSAQNENSKLNKIIQKTEAAIQTYQTGRNIKSTFTSAKKAQPRLNGATSHRVTPLKINSALSSRLKRDQRNPYSSESEDDSQE